MNELEVIRRTRQFLLRHPILDQTVARLYTDAHPTLLTDRSLRPFQRFILDTGDVVAYPDLVGQLADGESLIAVEAKGASDLLKGIAQAELYQSGFQFSFLAADAHALTASYITSAQQKNIGVLAVAEAVHPIYLPRPQKPYRDINRFLSRQMGTVLQLSAQQTFTYNVPTHYLVWPILIDSRHPRMMATFADWGAYPMPKDWRAALSGAQKLGLVRVQGKEVALTYPGEAARQILPDLATWAEVHRRVSVRKPPMLATVHPPAAALLRILLLRDPVVEMVVAGLENTARQRANFMELAMTCDSLDSARAPIFFLNPVTAARLIGDNRGRIPWERTVGEDYRSTTFYQYKRILQHAGLLAPNSLGGSTSKGYDPHRDIWELA